MSPGGNAQPQRLLSAQETGSRILWGLLETQLPVITFTQVQGGEVRNNAQLNNISVETSGLTFWLTLARLSLHNFTTRDT